MMGRQRIRRRCWTGGQGEHSRRTSKGSSWDFVKLIGLGSGRELVEGTSVVVGQKKS